MCLGLEDDEALPKVIQIKSCNPLECCLHNFLQTSKMSIMFKSENCRNEMCATQLL